MHCSSINFFIDHTHLRVSPSSSREKIYNIYNDKAQPHGAMLYTHDGTYQSPCDAAKSHAMLCDAFSNMLVILFMILGYLSYLLSGFQTVCTIMMAIQGAFL